MKSNTKRLAFSAIMIALATVLSFIRVSPLPWGGSVTLVSMLPICIVSVKYGVKWGGLTSLVYALIQLGQGIILDGLFGWGLTPGLLVSCMLLDYIIAFGILGFAGIFKSKGTAGWIAGTALVVFLRFVSHVLSGVFIFAAAGKLWEGFATDNTWIYSTLYNGSFMLPELIFTLIGSVILFKVPITKKLIEEE